MLPALALVVAGQVMPVRSIYASSATLRFTAIKAPSEVERYSVADFEVDADGTYDDPFDPAQVKLDAEVAGPDGRSVNTPGYLDRPFSRKIVNGAEQLEPTGPARWRLRVCPDRVGDYVVRATFTDKSGSLTRTATFHCKEGTDHGFIGVSPNDHRYFAFADGTSYWPLGENLAWAGPRGSQEVDDWLSKLGQHGANYVRFWLSPSWTTFAQEKPGKPADGAGLGQIDLGDAWRLDQALGTARKQGIYAMLCIDSYNVLRNFDAANWWEKTPHNSDNGGPLRIWREFWSSEVMDRLYKNRLRYLVARYAADTHVFAWEFWNEVDLVREYDPLVVRDWHSRMGRVLDGLDPYHHLRTTSLSATAGDRTIDLLPELDVMQTHSYNAGDPAGVVAQQQSRKSAWGKPHFFGEIGADSAGPRAEEDPDGMQIHDPIWAAIATGSSGSAMPWWWDSYVDPLNLYRLFEVPSKFLAGVDWANEGFRQTDVGLTAANPKSPLPKRDLILEDGPVSWARGPGMKPQAAAISNGKLMGDRPAGILHGTSNHPELHNPLTLRIRVTQATKFEIGVSSVSGWGGAHLQAWLDGSLALDKNFEDPDGTEKTDDLRQYAGTYTVTIPAGVHTIRIENTGKDWMRVGYRVVGALPASGPPLNAWAVVGDRTAMAWVRVAGRTWKAIAEQKRAIPAAPPSIIGLRGLRSGMWRSEVWDTWDGHVISTNKTRVGIDGRVRVSLPTITKDVAVKLVREGA